MSYEKTAIRVNNLSKCYHIYDRPQDRLKQSVVPRLQRLVGIPPKTYFRDFWALRDVSFEVKKGDTIGIIGRNGSGKSTLLQIICGTLTPTYGTFEINGRIAALLELGAGFNPEYTGRENVYMNGAILGCSAEEIDERFYDIAAFADIGEFIDQPVKTYSSGMYVRLAFAAIAYIEPDILVIDEAMAVGDMFFQARCFKRLREYQENGGTVLIASHDLLTVEHFCSKVLLLDHGHLVSQGTSVEVVNRFYVLGRAENADRTEPVKQPTVATEWVALRRDHLSGDGAADIQGAVFLNESGHPADTFNVGDWLIARMMVRFEIDLPAFDVAIGLRDKTGLLIGGAHSYHNAVGKFSAKAGDIRIYESRIQLNIVPGEYLLLLGIANNTSLNIWHEHCVLFDCAKITVVGKPDFWGCASLPITLGEIHP